MKEIPLSKGMTALVDDKDYRIVSVFKWSLFKHQSGRLYAFRRRIIPLDPDGSAVIYLHRFLTDARPDQIIHHINGNGLDNRRDNLLVCDQSGHARNHAFARILKKAIKILESETEGTKFF